MGCGCKNNAEQVTPKTVEAVQKSQQVTEESVQETIKKTIEKYYSTNKGK